MKCLKHAEVLAKEPDKKDYAKWIELFPAKKHPLGMPMTGNNLQQMAKSGISFLFFDWIVVKFFHREEVAEFARINRCKLCPYDKEKGCLQDTRCAERAAAMVYRVNLLDNKRWSEAERITKGAK